MISFFRNLINLFRFLFIITKYELLTSTGTISINKNISYFGKVLSFFLYPSALFFPTKQSFGVRLTKSFEVLGPIYIKLGQTLSTRPDLIGIEVAENLKYLQDKLPPFDISIVKAKIQTQLKATIEEIFAEFDPVPIAAASIAQVHKARLITGEQVAVKIIRPGIFERYNKDILFLEYLARLLTKWCRRTRRLRPEEVIKVFKETMYIELNFQTEAAAASRLYENCKSDNNIHIPLVFWHLTSTEILTLEWIEGTSIYDINKIRELGLNPQDLVSKVAVTFFNQAFKFGFFHADLHPGNILVCSDGKIALIDFGIMGALPEQDRLAIAEILYAFLARDYIRVAEVHYRAGYIPSYTNLDLFAQRCRAIAEPIMGLPIKNILIGNLLLKLFKITEEFGMETQPQLLLLQKTMVLVEGIGQSLYPETNMWQLAEPWIKKWAMKNLTPEAKLLRIMKKFINKLLDDHLY